MIVNSGKKENTSVPIGWTRATIHELIGNHGRFCDGDWVESEDQDPEGEVRLIQLADIGDIVFRDKSNRHLTLKRSQELSCTYLETGDILIARMPDPLGRACIFPLKGQNKFVTVVDVCIVRLGTDKINSKYLLYLINSLPIRLEIDTYKSGSTRKRISRKNLAKIELLIAPIAEQNRIVAKIEELFSELGAGIENLKTARSQLKIYRQSVLKWAFEGKLTAEWRQEQQRLGKLQSAEELLAQIKVERENRYQRQVEDWEKSIEVWEANGKIDKKPTKPQHLKEAKSFSDTEITELPKLMEGWCYVRAESISDFITKGTTPDKNELHSSHGDIPFIKVYNLTHGGALDFSINPTFVSSEIHNGFLSRSRVLPGDILMNIVGPPLGKISLIPDTFDEWNINQAIARYRLINIISNKYFLQYFLSQGTIDRMSKKAKATVGQFNLTLEICRDIEIPICGLEEQHQIVQEIESRLSICDNLENTIEENLQRAESLRQSILKQAFTGKLVPQDPNDEPAAQLLARIQQEQSAQQTLPLKPRKPAKKTP
jgi:type I restriction enzyme, S subunit